MTGGRIASEPGLRNGSLIYRCEASFSCEPDKVEKSVEAVKKRKLDDEPDSNTPPREPIAISKNKVLFWYFLFHVFLFESFWVRRLRQILEVRIVG